MPDTASPQMSTAVRPWLARFAATGLIALGIGAAAQQPAQAQTCTLGQIIWFGGDSAIRGTREANGQTLPIADYSGLYSVYGTRFGGDGEKTFALPDLTDTALAQDKKLTPLVCMERPLPTEGESSG